MSAATSPTAGPSMACHASAPRGPARAGPRGPGAITLPRRRPPQGLRPPACPRRSPRGPHPHSAADARGASEGATGASVDDAWLWLFTTSEQGAVECLGHPACKRGDRFAANQPVAGALTPRFGTRGVGAARGVELRRNHDNQHRNDDFPGPRRFHGFTPGFAFVGAPGTRGVSERFYRTLREPTIHGPTIATALNSPPPALPSSPPTTAHRVSGNSVAKVSSKPAAMINPPPFSLPL